MTEHNERCPFCGSEPQILRQEWAACTGASCRLRGVAFPLRLWNTRALLALPDTREREQVL